MGKREDKTADENSAIVLKGTTLSIFRFIFREGRPVRSREIQRGLGLSSVSIATYHLSKLLEAGLVRETDQGYVVDRIMFENIIRIRRLLIPVQISYVAFLATAIVALITILRPSVMYASYYFSVVILFIILVLSSLEVKRAMSRRV